MMNEFLANAYGTAQPVASQEDSEKIAEAQLFCKLAADANIDLSQLPDEKVAEMYQSYKVAAEAESKKEKREEKKSEEEEAKEKGAAAYAQFMQVKEAQAKLAEADYTGRVMAHAYVDELKKIAASGSGMGKVWHEGLEAAKGGLKRTGELLSGSRARELEGETAKHVSMAQKAKEIGGKLQSPAAKAKAWAVQGKHQAAVGGAKEEAQHEANKVLATRLGVGGGAAAVGGGVAAHHFMGKDEGKKKKASPMTEIAAELALYKAAEVGFDVEEAGERMDALLTLGVSDDNSKMAAADTIDQAVEIRSLELLEAAGYPVSW